MELQLKDANVLYTFGLIDKSELERLDRENNRQHSLLKEKQNVFELQMDNFVFELGISRQAKVRLLPVSSYTSLIPTDKNKIDFSGMIDVLLAEEEVSFNKKLADLAEGNSADLQKYYQKITETQIESKSIIQLQITQYVERLMQEEVVIVNQIKYEEERYQALQQSLNDMQLLLSVGKVIRREVETVETQRDKAFIILENAKLEYEIFKEKWWLATNGVLVTQ